VAIAILGLLVVWTGGSAGAGLKSILSSPAPPSTGEGGQTFAAASPVGRLGAGEWTVAGVPWSLEVAQMMGEDLSRRMENPPADLVDAAPSGRKVDDLLGLCRSICQAERRPDGCTVYALSRDDLRVRVYSRTRHGSELTMVAYLACRGEGDEWNLIVARPRPGAPAPECGAGAWPPLPDAVQLLCSRSDATGRLQCQLASSSVGPDALAAAWHAAGWTVQRQQSQERAVVLRCLCRDRDVSVFARHDSAGDRWLLVLIDAFPAGSETHD
jgi:hypothetical protein